MRFEASSFQIEVRELTPKRIMLRMLARLFAQQPAPNGATV